MYMLCMNVIMMEVVDGECSIVKCSADTPIGLAATVTVVNNMGLAVC